MENKYARGMRRESQKRCANGNRQDAPSLDVYTSFSDLQKSSPTTYRDHAPKMSRKRKQTLTRLAEEMCNKKKAKFCVEVAPAATPSNMDDSLELPGPSAIPVQGESDNNILESDGEDYRGEFTYDDARACYEDWLITLEKEQVQMMAMMLYDN